jgi:hypothetical protein
MLDIDTCIEKYYLRILIIIFILGWIYLYFVNQKKIDKITNKVKGWCLF